jgi:thiosulfate/3-mercaptopyruvate sulfurtransferase
MNIFSSARVYWQFKYFGHKQISVLDGGFPAWVAENYPVSDAQP